jgi:hypothetical protein
MKPLWLLTDLVGCSSVALGTPAMATGSETNQEELRPRAAIFYFPVLPQV